MTAELWAVFALAFVTGFSGAVMPGPVLSITVGKAAQRGLGAAMLVIVGHALVELALVIGLLHGLQALLRLPATFIALGLAGGGILLWMAFGMLRAGRRKETALAVEGRSSSLFSVGADAAASVSNPYFVLWWATAGSAQMAWAMSISPAFWLPFYVGHISSDFTWYAVVAHLIGRRRETLRPAVYRGLLVVCGIFLCVMGLFFAVSGAVNWAQGSAA